MRLDSTVQLLLRISLIFSIFIMLSLGCHSIRFPYSPDAQNLQTFELSNLLSIDPADGCIKNLISANLFRDRRCKVRIPPQMFATSRFGARHLRRFSRKVGSYSRNRSANLTIIFVSSKGSAIWDAKVGFVRLGQPAKCSHAHFSSGFVAMDTGGQFCPHVASCHR